jgi:hypothetical protein
MDEWLAGVSERLDRDERLSDLPSFARDCLKIRPKAGGIVPFVFNAAQMELHRRLEEQKRRTGRVRAVVLKARQTGISTYTAARFYHQTIRKPGTRTLIVGHEKRASTNLFQLVKRFHDLMPEDLKPSTGTSNSEELIFDKLDAGYLVTVATGEGTGRSATVQHLHASEVAFWPDLADQIAGLGQTIADLDNTEILIETTAHGFNEFYNFWRRAESGASEYEAIFLPWFTDPGYRTRLPEGFEMTSEEKALAETLKLDAEQICWRRNKVGQLGELWAQEYPSSSSEAFVSDSFDSFIPASLVLQARKQTDIEPYGPLVIGVDPAGKGADSTAIAWRQGHCITKIERRRGLDTMQVAGLVAEIIRKDGPAQVNIDVGGLGVGVYDRLVEQGHGSVVTAINFGGKPVQPPPFDELGKPAGGPANRRAEMYSFLKEALQEGRFSIPDSDSLHADLVSVGYKYRSDGCLLLESKDDMKRRGMPSPDEADACVLCFANPIGSPATTRVPGFNRKIEYFDLKY